MAVLTWHSRTSKADRSHWHTGPLLGFDLETTGVDPLTARVVSAAAIMVEPDGSVGSQQLWLVDPGVPIPTSASQVHGISTEQAQTEGIPAAQGVGEILDVLHQAIGRDIPIVVFNAPYDLTLIDAEARRHTHPSIAAALAEAAVIDPLVIDRGVDRYRRGKRTLTACCAHYGVELDQAHDAGADALAACLLARRMAESVAEVGALDAAGLTERQRQWHTDWATSFVQWRRKCGEPDFHLDAQWPIRSLG